MTWTLHHVFMFIVIPMYVGAGATLAWQASTAALRERERAGDTWGVVDNVKAVTVVFAWPVVILLIGWHNKRKSKN